MSEWQKMCSAPIEQPVLLWIKYGDVPVVGRLDGDGRVTVDREHHDVSCGTFCYGGCVTTANGTEATHWMPLPDPPENG
ncbi:DUF551 domain-containing protein [Sinimarinibacterium sp. NLF-5-8]|uniref:DUF551 domain-containing protein n=1 Tax=Sinimarinibacterium sp. NLF-5-8 TaxID=2698684 RepID=UPI00137C1F8A|nr:DUF551 domain-containing protein [Sinimarinibacterium sp. NLF-5-8]QHS09037.1 DUF551 domain-containing protein [Sinimarinibacterium sp. NLF-5-8]